MDKHRLQHKIEEQQKQWELLGEKQSELERARILETRPDEIFRLKKQIAEIQAECQQVEEELIKLEKGILTITVRGGELDELIGFLSALQNAYENLYAFDLKIQIIQQKEVSTEQIRSSVSPLSDVHEIVWPKDRLSVNKIKIESPGVVEVIGNWNPLLQIREYLKERHERKKDEKYREEQDYIKLILINERIKNKVLAERIQLLKEAGVPEEDIRRLVMKQGYEPLTKLGQYQDSGMIRFAEVKELPPVDVKQEQEFSFEVITVNAKGEVIDRKTHTARQQIEDLDNGVLLEMVFIPGGTFLMGSPDTEKGHEDNESPQHEVTVAPFYMSKYPVTQEQWEAVMGTNPSHFKGAKRPVERVSWNDAGEFSERLSEKTGRAYRLPSEAEWEYACRAGTTTPFHFGETITTDLANYNGEEEIYASEPQGMFREQTTDVGSFPPNAFGLYDMHGNVWEWCQDWYDNEYYAHSPSENPHGPETGSFRVFRGGSWGHFAGYCRAAGRASDEPGDRAFFLGFRLLRTPS